MIKYPKREDLHLIALDLDGTVLCPKSAKPITSRLRKIIRSLHQSGLPVTFVTGRTEDHAAPIARDLGLDVPLVTYNGARVFCPVEEKILHQSLIESKVASEISRWLGETEEVVACYLSRKGDLHLVQSRCSGNPEHDDFLFGTPRHLVGDLSSAIEGGGEVVKMIVSTQRPLQSEIPHLFGQVAQVVRTHEELVEILPMLHQKP